jgi:hypothetical protein
MSELGQSDFKDMLDLLNSISPSSNNTVARFPSLLQARIKTDQQSEDNNVPTGN